MNCPAHQARSARIKPRPMRIRSNLKARNAAPAAANYRPPEPSMAIACALGFRGTSPTDARLSVTRVLCRSARRVRPGRTGRFGAEERENRFRPGAAGRSPVMRIAVARHSRCHASRLGCMAFARPEGWASGARCCGAFLMPGRRKPGRSRSAHTLTALQRPSILDTCMGGRWGKGRCAQVLAGGSRPGPVERQS